MTDWRFPKKRRFVKDIWENFRSSRFTGLNNLKILSVMDVQFDEYFGFQDDEVKELLHYYGIEETYEDVRAWYDGYLLENASAGTCRGIEKLIAGELLLKEIKNELTYRDIYASEENIWSVLFTTGYLTQDGRPDLERRNLVKLVIPNEEVRTIFMTQIQAWMQTVVRKDAKKLDLFCEAVKNGAPSAVESVFTSWLESTISIRDTAVKKEMKENFYHGFLLGVLHCKTDWDVTSNKESGEGYADILIEIFPEKTGVIIEMKYAEKGELETSCRKAMEQIRNKAYAARLREDGMETIMADGIACFRKKCRVVLERVH